MTDYDRILDELTACRVRLDQIAAHVTGQKATVDLLPLWECGHRHSTRGEAIRCLNEQQDDAA